MPENASGFYTTGRKELAEGTIRLLADTIGVLLVTDAYMFNPDEDTVAQLAAFELSVAGYVRQNLANKSMVANKPARRAEFHADNPYWASLAEGQRVGGAVFFKVTGNDATARPILFIDHADILTNGSPFRLEKHADGWAHF